MSTSSTVPRAPRGLGHAGRSFWRALVTEYEFAPHELVLLKAAARTVDRLERLAEEEADADLVITHPQKGLVISPLLVEQRMASQALARLVASLRIPTDDSAGNGAGRGAYRAPKVISIAPEPHEDVV